MSRPVTSKEALLDAAMAIAEHQGIASLSIRGVARACGTSTGTVYNYFPAKENLTVAAIEHYFARAFYEEFCHPSPNENFAAYCEHLFEQVRRVISDFRTRWLADVAAIPTAERAAAALREHEMLDHVRSGLEVVFDRDPSIARDSLPIQLNAASVAQLVLDTLIGSLLYDHPADCTALAELLRGTLYRQQ